MSRAYLLQIISVLIFIEEALADNSQLSDRYMSRPPACRTLLSQISQAQNSSVGTFLRTLNYGLNTPNGIGGTLLSRAELTEMLKSEKPINPKIGRAKNSLEQSYSKALEKVVGELDHETWGIVKDLMTSLAQENASAQRGVTNGVRSTSQIFRKKILKEVSLSINSSHTNTVIKQMPTGEKYYVVLTDQQIVFMKFNANGTVDEDSFLYVNQVHDRATSVSIYEHSDKKMSVVLTFHHTVAFLPIVNGKLDSLKAFLNNLKPSDGINSGGKISSSPIFKTNSQGEDVMFVEVGASWYSLILPDTVEASKEPLIVPVHLRDRRLSRLSIRQNTRPLLFNSNGRDWIMAVLDLPDNIKLHNKMAIIPLFEFENISKQVATHEPEYFDMPFDETPDFDSIYGLAEEHALQSVKVNDSQEIIYVHVSRFDKPDSSHLFGWLFDSQQKLVKRLFKKMASNGAPDIRLSKYNIRLLGYLDGAVLTGVLSTNSNNARLLEVRRFDPNSPVDNDQLVSTDFLKNKVIGKQIFDLLVFPNGNIVAIIEEEGVLKIIDIYGSDK